MAPRTQSILQTCTHFYSFLSQTYLWRALFLAVFENPRLPERWYDWKF